MCIFDFFFLYCIVIGFDCLVQMFDNVQCVDQFSYLLYNIELVVEDKYWIIMVVVGFVCSEIDIEIENEIFKIIGCKQKEDKQVNFLYCGIVVCDFEQCFQLVNYIKVVGVNLENGLFNIELVCEIFEVLKLCKIEIGVVEDSNVQCLECVV